MHVIAFLDRNNIAMAIPAMRSSLGLSASSIGFATGSLFFTYIIMQIPAGRLASVWSAKKVVFISSLAWGVASLSTAFVTTGTELLLNRLFLGLVEGCETVTMIYLIRQWFSREERARALTCLNLSLPMASVFSNLISGFLLARYGWQLMFVLEAIPAFLWAVVWWFCIDDKPSESLWILDQDKAILAGRLSEEERNVAPIEGHWTRALLNPAIIIFTLCNILFLTGNLGVVLWLPSVLKESGLSITAVGSLSALTYGVGALGMIAASISSDYFQERKWHIIVLCILAGGFLALVCLVNPSNVFLLILLFSLVNGALYARFAVFWTWPSEILPAVYVGVAVGMINGLGNLGGFLGPFLFGYVRTATHGFTIALLVAGASIVLSGLLCIPVKPPTRIARVTSTATGVAGAAAK
jgi:MFS family permease